MMYGSEKRSLEIHRDNMGLIDSLAGDTDEGREVIMSMVVHYGCEFIRNLYGLPMLGEFPMHREVH